MYVIVYISYIFYLTYIYIYLTIYIYIDVRNGDGYLGWRTQQTCGGIIYNSTAVGMADRKLHNQRHYVRECQKMVGLPPDHGISDKLRGGIKQSLQRNMM